MLKFKKLATLMTLAAVWPFLTPDARAEALRFAWPDGASAKVQTRSQGRRAEPGNEINWDMNADFTMQVRRMGGRVVISRHDFSGWKGTLPPSFAGGAERFTDMVPTFVVAADGSFIGIEGQEAARKLMYRSVEQSGGLDAPSRSVFETITSDASLGAMSKDYWAMLVRLWEDVELNPEAVFEFSTVNPVPQLGGGDLEINGEVRFVKEAPCAPGGGGRQCALFRAETAANKEQVMKLVQALMKQAAGGNPVITDWEQRNRAEIVLDKATMLPQQLTLTRLHAMEVTARGRKERGTEEITKTYTFAWTLPDGGQKK